MQTIGQETFGTDTARYRPLEFGPSIDKAHFLVIAYLLGSLHIGFGVRIRSSMLPYELVGHAQSLVHCVAERGYTLPWADEDNPGRRVTLSNAGED